MGVKRDERRERATSFSLVAGEYERARPGYPDDAVRWLVGEAPQDVVDLGAGTGKLTRSLVALGHRVTAVEPLEEMLAHLRKVVPAATAVVGTAEDIPLADGTADVVASAQAFHWFDQPVALKEIGRALRPGGRLALTWNTRDDRVEWVARLNEIVEPIEPSGLFGMVERATLPIDESGLFGPVERATFSFAQRLDREGLRELVLSRSYCATRAPAEQEPVLAEVDRLFDEHAEGGPIELPYLTECFRARLRA